MRISKEDDKCFLSVSTECWPKKKKKCLPSNEKYSERKHKPRVLCYLFHLTNLTYLEVQLISYVLYDISNDYSSQQLSVTLNNNNYYLENK